VSRSRPPEEGRLIQLVYYAFVAGSRLALALPEGLAYRLADLAGTAWWRCDGRRRAQVARNLARVTGSPAESPRLEAMVAAAFKSYSRYWFETFRLARETPSFFLERFECRGADRIDEVRRRGKGAIVVVGHLGNWDAAGAWAGASGRSVVTVAEVLKPRRVFEFFRDHRARLGISIYPAERGVTARLVEAIEDGKVVAILGDRDLKGNGVEVQFFGEATTLPAGPASIALRTGVPLLIAGVYGTVLPDGRRAWIAEISEPIELPSERGAQSLRRLTQEVARGLETAVARRPEEWHVFQPFWLADRRRPLQQEQVG
jgi:phosphatidylinositol dimannoside acyltransferase